MAIDIEKPSEVSQIKAAPGIKLENLIQFNGDCVDPLALVIITEALDYALETAVRRLRSAGKVFSGAEESAYGQGKGVLPVIKAVRDAIQMAPQCSPGGGPPVVKPPPPEKVIITKAEARTKEQTKLEKPKPVKGEEAIQKIWDTLGVPERATIAKSAGLEGKVGSQTWAYVTAPDKEKVSNWMRAQAKTAKAKKEEPSRRLPKVWGSNIWYEGKPYDSLGALASELGFTTKGADTQIIGFERAGFTVTSNGEPEKGKKLTVTKIPGFGPIPSEYKVTKEKKEVVERFTEAEKLYPRPWATITKEGKLVRYEDAEGKPIPREMWPIKKKKK